MDDFAQTSGKKMILAYDCLGSDVEFVLDRNEEETNEEYAARVSHFNMFFPVAAQPSMMD